MNSLYLIASKKLEILAMSAIGKPETCSTSAQLLLLEASSKANIIAKAINRYDQYDTPLIIRTKSSFRFTRVSTSRLLQILLRFMMVFLLSETESPAKFPAIWAFTKSRSLESRLPFALLKTTFMNLRDFSSKGLFFILNY